MEIRTTFRKKLQDIQDELLAMGSMVEKAIVRSVEALKQRDQEAAREIVERDQEINAKRFEIEDACLFLIASQPFALEYNRIYSVSPRLVGFLKRGLTHTLLQQTDLEDTSLFQKFFHIPLGLQNSLIEGVSYLHLLLVELRGFCEKGVLYFLRQRSNLYAFLPPRLTHRGRFY